MKRLLLIVIPLALFVGFLFVKPPAIGAGNTKVITSPSKSKESNTTTSQDTQINKPNNGKTPVIKGENENEDNERSDKRKHREKPRYSGHDDDDYDD